MSSDQPEGTGRPWVPSDTDWNDGVKRERWTWTLATTAHESAVELWRDDDHRLTLPLTADQVELLLGRPHTLASVFEADG